MRIVTNAGSNLTEEVLQHYGIDLSAQNIVVDGVAHDTRLGIPLKDVDLWVRESKEFPHVVGTTAQEFMSLLARLVREDPHVLVITTSKKIIQSHAAALAAARTLEAQPSSAHVKIAVVDSTMTDLAPGLLSIIAGEARKAGITLARTVHLLDLLAIRGRMAFTVGTLDNLVKGGRASWLRAQIANFLDIKPMIGFVDGELKNVAKIPGKDNPYRALVSHMEREIGRGRCVWAGVFHGAAPEKAHGLIAELKKSFAVQYVFCRPLASSIYLHLGRGAIGLAVFPMDDVPWTPPVPPDFSR